MTSILAWIRGSHSICPNMMAFPNQCVLDPSAVSSGDGQKIKDAMPAGHVDLNQKEESVNLNVGAIIMATGWDPYDATKMDNLCFGKYDNIVTNMMVERMASPSGPTDGKIVKPSDKEEPKTVGFVQCAGSRDENHLKYCSYICCMATLKQACYLREQSEDVEIYIFYIDIRSPGLKYERFYKKGQGRQKGPLYQGQGGRGKRGVESRQCRTGGGRRYWRRQGRTGSRPCGTGHGDAAGRGGQHGFQE